MPSRAMSERKALAAPVRVLLFSILLLGATPRAHAESAVIPITPLTLDQRLYTFTVTSTSGTAGVAFHVTITAKRDDIPADSGAGVFINHETKDQSGWTIWGESIDPAISITLKKEPRLWIADFIVPAPLLKNPGLCFGFSEPSYSLANGKRVRMPAEDRYNIRLANFTK